MIYMGPDEVTALDVFWRYFKDIIVIATPLIIAWCGWKVTTAEKESKRYRELRDQRDKLAEDLHKTEVNAQNTAIENINNEIVGIRGEIKKLDTEKIFRQIERITDMTNANFEYSQSLSKIVTCLGEVMETSDTILSAGKIHDAIHLHQDKEREIVTRICKLEY